MINPMVILRLKQEVEKFKDGQESELKIFKVQKYPGFVSFELSLSEKMFNEMKLQEIMPKDLPQLEGK